VLVAVVVAVVVAVFVTVAVVVGPVTVVVGPETVAVVVEVGPVTVAVVVAVDVSVVLVPVCVDVVVLVAVVEGFARYATPAPITSPPTTPAPIFKNVLLSGEPDEVVVLLLDSAMPESPENQYIRINQHLVVYLHGCTQRMVARWLFVMTMDVAFSTSIPDV
jgi:hypothetical protein